MINRFSQFLIEEEKTVYFTFGRMNPPTIGHGKLMDSLAKKAGRNPYYIYLSQSENNKKDPIPYASKIKHVRKMFPKHARQVVIKKKAINPFYALTDLYNKGFRKIVMVAGSDRVSQYDIQLNKYNGKKSNHGFFNFEGGIKVISAGQRDADSDGAEGASGTKQRKYAVDGDFSKFGQGLPSGMSNRDAKKLFNDVRKGLGLKEQHEFKRHLQLKSLSETREAFVKGELYKEGDEVIIKKTNEVGEITVVGSNYVIVETSMGKTRQWLESVELIAERELSKKEITKRDKVAKDLPKKDFKDRYGKDGDSVRYAVATKIAKKEEYKYGEGTPEATKHAKKMTPGQKEGNGLWANIHAKRRRGERMRKKGEKGAPTPDQIKRAQEDISTPQDKDIADRKGTQPARYHAGLSKATKIARDAHFKAKKSGPAPGDANAETKPSSHTKFVRKMMGEDSFAAKSKASGISVGTLKKVYRRGVAAWKTGHRPGTTPTQWGHARVNAFIKKKKQGGLNHDKDLA